MHKLPSEGAQLPLLPPEPSAEEVERRLGENWTWPSRRDHPGVAGPEPVRLAFRRFLAGGALYRR